jgi:hypothetical protein
MKSFLVYTAITIIILAGIFTAILYSEGAFDNPEPKTEKALAPFMKCEAGKCATGKCGQN